VCLRTALHARAKGCAASSLDSMSDNMKKQVMDVGGIMVHQLLCGRDIAVPRTASDPMVGKIFDFAMNMRNFVYLIIDPQSREALVLDACWDVDGVFRYAAELGVNITAALYTHSHFDHAGGHVPPSMTGGLPVCLPGAQDLVKRKVPIWAGSTDREDIAKQCQVPEAALQTLREGGALGVGNVKCVAFHTPGHTPGSVCLFVPCGGGGGGNECLGSGGERVPAGQGALLSGDTLFVQSCGRTDLPGSDQMGMFQSLSRLCQGLPDGCVVCPGHDYAPVPHTTIGQEKSTNQMVMMGMQMFASPGSLAEYPRCKCMDSFKTVADEIFAKPALTVRSLGGGELALDGVPFQHARASDLKHLILEHLRSSKDSDAKARKLRSPGDLSLADGAGNRHLKDSDDLTDPELEFEGVALFGAELPDVPARRPWFLPGSMVVLGGLRAAAELNGQHAEVCKWGVAKGRYEVRLREGGDMKSVKADNLFTADVVTPPVPDVD